MLPHVRLTFLIVFVLSMIALSPAQAASSPAEQAGQRVLERIFTEAEKAMIEEYFGSGTDRGSAHEQCPRDGKCKKCKHHGNKEHHGHSKHGEKHSKKENCAHGAMKAQGKLPPGLEKQLRRNGHLPPGLEGRSLPPGLAKRLPPPAHGTERRIIGDDVVLVDTATQVILDVIRNVMKPPSDNGRNGYNN